MRGQPGFFDGNDRLKRLSDLGDQLEAFRTAVDFELFRPGLFGWGARRPAVVRSGDDVQDSSRRRIIMRLGLGLSDRVPDAPTIWLFRERLTERDGCRRLRGPQQSARGTSRQDQHGERRTYRSAANEEFMEKNGFISHVHCN
jgi:hypothetical protein